MRQEHQTAEKPYITVKPSVPQANVELRVFSILGLSALAPVDNILRVNSACTAEDT